MAKVKLENLEDIKNLTPNKSVISFKSEGLQLYIGQTKSSRITWILSRGDLEFDKDIIYKRGYCTENLAVNEQSELYSRLIDLGPLACFSPETKGYKELDGLLTQAGIKKEE